MRQPDQETRTADSQGVRLHSGPKARNGLPEGLYRAGIKVFARLPGTGKPNPRARSRANNLKENGATTTGSLRDHVNCGVQYIMEARSVPPPGSNGLPSHNEGNLVLAVLVRKLAAELPQIDGLPALRRKSSLLEQVPLRDLAPFEQAK